jgi:hypothetical protein
MTEKIREVSAIIFCEMIKNFSILQIALLFSIVKFTKWVVNSSRLGED